MARKTPRITAKCGVGHPEQTPRRVSGCGRSSHFLLSVLPSPWCSGRDLLWARDPGGVGAGGDTHTRSAVGKEGGRGRGGSNLTFKDKPHHFHLPRFLPCFRVTCRRSRCLCRVADDARGLGLREVGTPGRLRLDVDPHSPKLIAPPEWPPGPCALTRAATA